MSHRAYARSRQSHLSIETIQGKCPERSSNSLCYFTKAVDEYRFTAVHSYHNSRGVMYLFSKTGSLPKVYDTLSA